MPSIRFIVLLASAFSMIEALPGHRPRSACKTSGLLASLTDGRFAYVASEFCSGYLEPTIFAIDTITKTQTAITTDINTQIDTVYQTEQSTVTNTETVYATIATALESLTTGTVTEVSMTATATNDITISTETDLSTLSTETDAFTLATEFVTVYTPTVTEIDTVTLTVTTLFPDKLKARACTAPLCWIEGFAASEISSACSCIIKPPSPTRTVYTKTTVVPKTIVQMDIVQATSTIYSSVNLIQSTLDISTVYVTTTSTIDVAATTVLGVEATTDVDVKATSVEDVTTTTTIDITSTSIIDEATTITSSTTASATLSCLNPITNGGFDTGSLDPWTNRGSSDTYTLVSPGYNSSAYAIEVTFSGSNSGAFILDQGITVCPGITYNYTFGVNIPASSSALDGPAELDVSVNVFGSFNSYSDASMVFYSTTNGYAEITGWFNAASADIGVELEFNFIFHEHSPSTFTFYIDDFMMTAKP